MGRGQIPPEEMERRLAETQRVLVRRRGYLDVQNEIAARFKVSTRTAREYIRKVKKRWREQAEVETADESRDDLIAQLDAVLSSCWNATVIVKDGAGNPVLDQATTLADGVTPNPNFGRPLVKNEPRIQHILHAVSQLRALKGADRPTKSVVTLDGDIGLMPDVGSLPETVQKSLRDELTKLAGGDLRNLAGEWFRRAEPEKPGG